MKYIRDTVHGFTERPHYEAAELDAMFEKIVVDYLKKKHGAARFPITTDELTTLIEQDVDDLDQYADLSKYGEGVEGLTEFRGRGKPKVCISETVHRYENRLRTTLTHEFGHVKLHAYLFAMGNPRLLVPGPNRQPDTIYCMRDGMLPIGKRDWMEWQAGYASGAALMPKSYVVKSVVPIQQERSIYGSVLPETDDGAKMIAAVVSGFAVSRDAATVRLKVLGFLGAAPAQKSLFA